MLCPRIWEAVNWYLKHRICSGILLKLMFLSVRDGSIMPNRIIKFRSLANLVNIYYRSVGCNSVLLLNIPPDKRGLMHENDVKRIKELTEYIKKDLC